ncbi:reverse transcriptase domain-containing protein [Microcoleus sp.]|uniref:reverse transcriptase domain-containing protein n=1 Tax=Microcoleus sp. TaxID=44472 RepID=UPI00403EC5D6
MGALYLKPLDDRMADLGCFYVRFMDDWVVLAPTRWRLRKAIKAVNEVMADLRVEQHPDKTFIGRIARGFDFLGYWFTTEGLGIAGKTVERFAERVSQLYEQGAGENRIEEYVRRSWRWVRSGVGLYFGDGSCRLGWRAMLLNLLPKCKGDLTNTLIGGALLRSRTLQDQAIALSPFNPTYQASDRTAVYHLIALQDRDPTSKTVATRSRSAFSRR